MRRPDRQLAPHLLGFLVMGAALLAASAASGHNLGNTGALAQDVQAAVKSIGLDLPDLQVVGKMGGDVYGVGNRIQTTGLLFQGTLRSSNGVELTVRVPAAAEVTHLPPGYRKGSRGGVLIGYSYGETSRNQVEIVDIRHTGGDGSLKGLFNAGTLKTWLQRQARPMRQHLAGALMNPGQVRYSTRSEGLHPFFRRASVKQPVKQTAAPVSLFPLRIKGESGQLGLVAQPVAKNEAWKYGVRPRR